MRPVALAFVLVFPAAASAQVVTDMTPERVREAVAYGSTGKAALYRIGGGLTSPLTALYTTPFLRVALAAGEAKAQYRPFDEAAVSAELLLPGVVEVYAPARPPEARYGSPAVSVKAVVVMPSGGKDAALAIHPTRTVPGIERYANLLGATQDAIGLTAHFPLRALSEGNELRVIYSDGHEAKGRFKLEKVR